MDLKNVLVVGAKGQLGTQLMKFAECGECALGKLAEVYSNATFRGVDLPEIDITDVNSVREVLLKDRPQVVINCAAFTNVDGCETNECAAHAVNANGAENLATACKEIDAVFVHVSTDYVFPGNEPGERVESDETSPISAYGRTKLEGEVRAQKAWEKTHIVRTAWLYGLYGKNFVDTMVNLAKTHDELNVVADQFGNPTNAEDLAFELTEIALSNSFGIWHVTGEGSCTWADLAEKAINLNGLNCTVNRVTSEEYKAINPKSADRPHYSSLKNKHLEDTIGNKMRPWEEALKSFMKNYRS